MELLNTLYNLMGLVLVLGTLVSMSLSPTEAQITGPLRKVRFVVVALLTSMIQVILTVVGGYLVGRLGKADSWLQALDAGQRNIAAAMVVATMNWGKDEIVGDRGRSGRARLRTRLTRSGLLMGLIAQYRSAVVSVPMEEGEKGRKLL